MKRTSVTTADASIFFGIVGVVFLMIEGIVAQRNFYFVDPTGQTHYEMLTSSRDFNMSVNSVLNCNGTLTGTINGDFNRIDIDYDSTQMLYRLANDMAQHGFEECITKNWSVTSTAILKWAGIVSVGLIGLLCLGVCVLYALGLTGMACQCINERSKTCFDFFRNKQGQQRANENTPLSETNQASHIFKL